jgi:hypothetical protein
MRAAGAAASLFLLAAGCESAQSSDRPRPPPVTERPAAGGCAFTPAAVGGRPDWAPDPSDAVTPYVLADPPSAVAILAADPVRAGHPTNPANKVVFAVRTPRHGTPLRITARATTGQTVAFEIPADVLDAEVYITYLDLPAPGCWKLELRWGAPEVRTSLYVDVTR